MEQKTGTSSLRNEIYHGYTLDELVSKTARLELGIPDSVALERAVADFRPVFAAHQLALRAIQPPTRGMVTATAAQAAFEQDQTLAIFVSKTYRELIASMSPTGQTKLAAHLVRMKTRIRIVGPPPM